MTARGSRPLAIGLLIAAVLVAVVLSQFASGDPDGLERVAEDNGISQAEGEHATADGPLADYEAKGVDEPWLSGGVAGLIGVLAVAAAGTGLFMLLRPRGSASGRAGTTTADDDPATLPR